jgi:hypothetical protein
MARLVLLFILLTSAACNASMNGAPTATRVPTRAANVTDAAADEAAFVMPTLPPSPTPACPRAPRTRLIVNERGRVMPDDPRPVNMRPEPGLDQNFFAQIPIEGVFYVLEGPVCEGGFAWFMVSYQGREGWIAEGEADYYYVEPYLEG